ncbi:MAG: hypothetical protein ACOYNC_02410 [Bacteroidales bacterium]
MNFKTIIVFLLFCGCTGCVNIVKWRYGIKNPAEETPAKLISFLEKHHFPDSCQYIFNDSGAYCTSLRNPLFKKNLLSHMIFDANGALIKHDTSQCQWSGYEVIRALNRDSAVIRDEAGHLNELLTLIHPLHGDQSAVAFEAEPDFTVVITWAKFLGTYNARLFDLARAAALNNKSRIRLIFLNIDMQESWMLTKDQKMGIR